MASRRCSPSLGVSSLDFGPLARAAFFLCRTSDAARTDVPRGPRGARPAPALRSPPDAARGDEPCARLCPRPCARRSAVARIAAVYVSSRLSRDCRATWVSIDPVAVLVFCSCTGREWTARCSTCLRSDFPLDFPLDFPPAPARRDGRSHGTRPTWPMHSAPPGPPFWPGPSWRRRGTSSTERGPSRDAVIRRARPPRRRAPPGRPARPFQPRTRDARSRSGEFRAAGPMPVRQLRRTTDAGDAGSAAPRRRRNLRLSHDVPPAVAVPG
ncbi:hypothetical protein OPKNFCMD_0987 [Methylobacterium crusticola]|uniref:Uncharacterized protein n=1 Tax=Methylobacterium crusticola TaxID=1697972 RepID=A0ABQ4QSG3_9HYPH|nr:hypothetical protein OPKNFCMD_0987 [Methylobacterium crusticola]